MPISADQVSVDADAYTAVYDNQVLMLVNRVVNDGQAVYRLRLSAPLLARLKSFGIVPRVQSWERNSSNVALSQAQTIGANHYNFVEQLESIKNNLE